MRIIKVETKAQLDELYKDCSFAIEGITPNEKNIKELLSIVKTYTPLWRNDVYTIEGPVMNREYGLTGTNAYPDTDTIICIKCSDMKHSIAFAYWHSRVGWQYFHEIRDSHLRMKATIPRYYRIVDMTCTNKHGCVHAKKNEEDKEKK